ncbi:hypothetical protein [Microbacterium sp. SD291]|uniref:hypothetical protein n=1 Tax=Microbacterium sp. SD291 TaxID=2782007 RepID=UPI001A958C2F|nr:hypothetical protein [Microbacterium sp. SD291]MBO0981211.1 hypothetical protein [Microbacterium sp. SD291]
MTDTSATGPTTPRPSLLSFAIGALGGIAGLLPWLVGGGRLPLQNLWATQTMPRDMPFSPLPISQYFVALLFSLVLLGGVFAGLAVHVAGQRRPLVAWQAALGVAAVHMIAVVLSFGVLAAGLGFGSGVDPRAILYLAGMLGGTIAAVLMAQVGFWMTSRRSVGVVSLGVALAAVPFGNWVGRWFAAFTGDAFVPPFVYSLERWLPAVVVGAALIWCGVRPVWRLVVWVVALLALWVTPALFTAIQAGLGMRVLQGDVAEMAAVSVQLFPLVLAEVWMPVVVGFAIAVVGTTVRMLVAKAPREIETGERVEASPGR